MVLLSPSRLVGGAAFPPFVPFFLWVVLLGLLFLAPPLGGAAWLSFLLLITSIKIQSSTVQHHKVKQHTVLKVDLVAATAFLPLLCAVLLSSLSLGRCCCPLPPSFEWYCFHSSPLSARCCLCLLLLSGGATHSLPPFELLLLSQLSPFWVVPAFVSPPLSGAAFSLPPYGVVLLSPTSLFWVVPPSHASLFSGGAAWSPSASLGWCCFRLLFLLGGGAVLLSLE